jgi:Outer membrane protein beta-barrel domain
LPITRLLIAVAAVFVILEGSASAQAMFSGSIGNVFGGDAPSTKRTWAVSIGGSGAHGIGSELEFSRTKNFFEAADGRTHGEVLTLMPSIFVAAPIGKLRPYGIFGFGFIRQRTESSTGGILANLSDNDIGYNIGGGLIFKFAGAAGVRVDLRRFKVRKADGISFNRLMFGIVLGG